MEAFEANRRDIRQRVLGENSVLTRSGYLSTTAGCVHTSSKALLLIKVKERRELLARENRDQMAAKRSLRAAAPSHCARRELRPANDLALRRRATLAGMSIESFIGQLRSLEKSRALARPRTLRKFINK